ncbi:shikimate kinase [Deltaproteobacteria bacterium]|nr:shikimate kinase [Deltaproteobacteria bacterium]
MNIILIGFKSCGKSTVGALLAASCGRDFMDTDTEVERLFEAKQGKRLSCRAIYTRLGEDFLRDLETEVLTGPAAGTSDTIIAAGGGIVLRKENIPLLHKAGLCVFLDVALPLLEERLARQALSPLFQKKGIAGLYRERHPFYLAAANICHPITERAGPEEIVRQLCKRLFADQ